MYIRKKCLTLAFKGKEIKAYPYTGTDEYFYFELLLNKNPMVYIAAEKYEK